MADSTDEDAARFAHSQEIGVIESEYAPLAGRGFDVEEGGVSQDDDEATEGRLQIRENSGEVRQGSTSDETATVGDCHSGGGLLQPSRKVAGFGEIDEGSSDDNACDDETADSARGGGDDPFDDDALSNHSSGSDARHDLDYLHDQKGRFLSYLLMAR